MLRTRLYRLIYDKRLSVPILRCFHHEFTQPEPPKSNDDERIDSKLKHGKDVTKENRDTKPSLAGAVSQKYNVFRDEDATEIFDVEEERQRYHIQDEPEHDVQSQYYGLNLEHGIHGVFDVEDLVDVLRKENAEDIFVCSVPKELKYVDHMVICSGRSYRHMLAMAEFVRRLYKIKRSKGDILPRIEGEKSRNWMALDLCNIALHIFSPETREEYDLESLWAIGAEYDKESNKPKDRVVELLERHSQLLADIQPKPPSTDT